jgi:hypothetical protein
MTNGTVFERVPGKTMTVRDPLRLAALFARGDNARREAELRANRAALALHESNWDGYGTKAKIVHSTVAVGPTGRAGNVTRLLFRHEFAEHLSACIIAALGKGDISRAEILWSQSALTCRFTTTGGHSKMVARVSWDGTAAVHLELDPAFVSVDSLGQDWVTPAWRLADELVSHLGGYGDFFLVMLFYGGPFRPYAPRPKHPVRVQRGPFAPGVGIDDAADVEREIVRTLGKAAPEP